MEQPRKESIAYPYQQADNSHCHANHTRISDQFLAGGPRHLLHLGNYFIKEALGMEAALAGRCFFVGQVISHPHSAIGRSLRFLVKRMLANKKNNVRINWLTGRKAAFRFMTAGLRKRDLFAE